MADINQNKAEQYRKERKARLAKAAKKNAKNIEKKTAIRSAVKKVVAIVLAAAIALTCLGGILNYVGVLQKAAQIGYVGDEHISFAEYKYYYLTTYNSFWSQTYQASYYGTNLGYEYDITLTPEEQTTTYTDGNGNEMTWVEYFRQQALDTAQQYLAYYQEAQKKNITLDESEKKEIEDSIEELRETANAYNNDDSGNKGYSLNAYLRLQYGNGITESFIKKQMEIEALAKKYLTAMSDEIKESYSDDKIKEEYNKDPDSYLYTDIRLYQFTIETVTAEDGEDEDAVAKKQKEADKKTKEDANEMYKEIKDEKSFINCAKNLNADDKEYDADAATLIKSYRKNAQSESDTYNLSSINSDLAEWAFDKNTKQNDKKLITIKGEDDAVTGYIVALMVNPKHDVETVSVRHILFKTVDDSNNALSDEEIKAAKTKASETLAEWEAGDKTEESFADYAKELSEDPGSQSDGGLYEHITPNYMVTEFNDWVFDDSHKKGDCEIVETSYGYHIIYYVGKDGRTASNETIRTNLASEDSQKKAEEILAGDEYKVGVGARRIEFVEKQALKQVAKQVANVKSQLSSSSY